MIILGIGYIALGLFIFGDILIRQRWRVSDGDLAYWLSLSVLLGLTGVVQLLA